MPKTFHTFIPDNNSLCLMCGYRKGEPWHNVPTDKQYPGPKPPAPPTPPKKRASH